MALNLSIVAFFVLNLLFGVFNASEGNAWAALIAGIGAGVTGSLIIKIAVDASYR